MVENLYFGVHGLYWSIQLNNNYLKFVLDYKIYREWWYIMILQNKRIELNNSFPIPNIKDLANDKELRYIQISDYISKELILLLNEHVFIN